MKKKILLMIFLTCLPVFAAMAGEKIGPMPTDLIGKAAWIKSVIGDVIGKVSDPARHFYGVVVDQHGAPVAGVELEASWRYISLDLRDKVKEVTLTTDAAGRFDFTFGFFGQPGVHGIRKKGYEYIYSWNPYDNAVNNQMDLIAQSPTTPILFILRKMGNTTYLLKTDYGFRAKEPVDSIAYDLAKRRYYNMNKVSNRGPAIVDLAYDFNRDDVSGTYTLRFYVPQKAIKQPIVEPPATSGMLLSDTLFYEAPASGYEKEVTMTFKPGDDVTKYLYLTSRNPAVYSRMKMKFRVDQEDLVLDAEIWTNPYGSKNLEYEPDLPWSLENKLENEAEAALKSGKLPPEPNIPQMIASGLYK